MAEWSLLSVGIILFAIGLVLWTIGGLISFATQYDVHNRYLRADFDLKRPTEDERPAFKEMWDVYFNNPKSKWCRRIGYSVAILGFILIWSQT